MDEPKYALSVEWYDDVAALMRPFTFFYYPRDGSVEMFDTKQRKTFLRRTPCRDILDEDLYEGNIVRVMSRELKILRYLDSFTAPSLQRKAERTYAMLKPEVVEQMGRVLAFVEERGFRFNRLMLTHLSPESASHFYAEHAGRSFYERLVEYISSGPVLAMELRAPSAVAAWRQTLGPTDPEKARLESPDTLRARFGTDTTYNAAHGSDSVQAAVRELSLVFDRETSYLRPSDAYTLCLVKGHVLADGQLGRLIGHVQDNHFDVVGLRLLRLSADQAERFFESYRGVWNDYPAQIKQWTSSPIVAVAIGADVDRFRDFVGPFDAEVARKLRPTSLRGMFGRDVVENAVYCTDLSDDGRLEVEFFFDPALDPPE